MKDEVWQGINEVNIFIQKTWIIYIILDRVYKGLKFMILRRNS